MAPRTVTPYQLPVSSIDCSVNELSGALHTSAAYYRSSLYKTPEVICVSAQN